MQIYPVVPGMILDLGKFGTNITRAYRFNIKQWQEDYPTAIPYVLHKRPDMTTPAPVANTVVGDGYIDWIISSGDVAVVGEGSAEVVLIEQNAEIDKSGTFVTVIQESITPVDDDPPDPYEGWVEDILDAAATVQTSANAAAASATAAAGSATAAAGSATAAAGSATAAAGSASEAAAAKTTAQGYVTSAAGYVLGAKEHKLNAEAWATGEKDGEAVPSTASQYHNNAKYYSQEAAGSAEAAADSAGDAADSADAAAASASAAQDVMDSYDAMTATVTMLPSTSEPTVEIDHTGDAPVLELGIPKAKSGVYVGSSEPGPDYDVWIDPEGSTNVTEANGVSF